jgi:hypothetical protein
VEGSLLVDIKTLARGGYGVVGDDPGECVLGRGMGLITSDVEEGSLRFSEFFPFF